MLALLKLSTCLQSTSTCWCSLSLLCFGTVTKSLLKMSDEEDSEDINFSRNCPTHIQNKISATKLAYQNQNYSIVYNSSDEEPGEVGSEQFENIGKCLDFKVIFRLIMTNKCLILGDENNQGEGSSETVDNVGQSGIDNPTSDNNGQGAFENLEQSEQGNGSNTTEISELINPQPSTSGINIILEDNLSDLSDFEEKQFECDHCHKKFNESEYENHLDDIYGKRPDHSLSDLSDFEEKQIECDHCHKKFYESDYENHLKDIFGKPALSEEVFLARQLQNALNIEGKYQADDESNDEFADPIIVQDGRGNKKAKQKGTGKKSSKSISRNPQVQDNDEDDEHQDLNEDHDDADNADSTGVEENPPAGFLEDQEVYTNPMFSIFRKGIGFRFQRNFLYHDMHILLKTVMKEKGKVFLKDNLEAIKTALLHAMEEIKAIFKPNQEFYLCMEQSEIGGKLDFKLILKD